MRNREIRRRTGSELEKFEYTAFEEWDYKQVIYKTEHKRSWRSLADSFFRANHDLVRSVVTRELYDDVEGLAAIFLFRHYLELALKLFRWALNAGSPCRVGYFCARHLLPPVF